jgi:hypothetical protein
MKLRAMLFLGRKLPTLAGVIVGAAMLIARPLWGAEAAYEPASVLRASKILSPEILSGPNHRVQERVTNDGYLNTYTIDSKFGPFTALSTAMLRKRIGKINALAVMEKIEGTKEFSNSLKRAGADTLGSMKNLVAHPVSTVSGAISGLGTAFRRASDSLTGPKRSDAEDSSIKDAIGFAKVKRDYAYQLHVDVYSDNAKLQEELNKISWAGFGGSLTWSAAMMAVPGGAGIAVSVAGTSRLLNEQFRITPPVDLRRMNGEKLAAMDVHPEIADAFLNNSVFSPRHQTLFVHALEEMKGVKNRAAYVGFASTTQNSSMAFFRERQAEMYAGYHKAVAPLGNFVSLGELAAARTADGSVVFCAPLDHLVWTEPVGRFITAANKIIDEAGPKKKQLWVTGTLSPRARNELASRGWHVQERSESRLLSWVDSDPKLDKRDEQPPSGTVSVTFQSVALGVGKSRGEGVLTFQGKEYPFAVSGLSLGDIGVSTFIGAGKVYALKAVKDFPGTYAAAQSSLAISGGSSDVSMRNHAGVLIVLVGSEGKESGTRLSLGASGVSINMK